MKATPPRSFETARLTIRALRADDWKVIFETYANDPEVAQFMSWRCTGNPDDTRSFTEAAARVWNGERIQPYRFDYVVCLKNTNELIGSIGFEPQGMSASIGYNYAKKHWRRGYASEALGCLTEWLLKEGGMFRVWAVHDVDNPVSGRVMEKCGFLREGMLRRSSVHPNVSDEPRDAVLWAKVR